jgi:hypothetical protein
MQSRPFTRHCQDAFLVRTPKCPRPPARNAEARYPVSKFLNTEVTLDANLLT